MASKRVYEVRVFAGDGFDGTYVYSQLWSTCRAAQADMRTVISRFLPSMYTKCIPRKFVMRKTGNCRTRPFKRLRYWIMTQGAMGLPGKPNRNRRVFSISEKRYV